MKEPKPLALVISWYFTRVPFHDGIHLPYVHVRARVIARLWWVSSAVFGFEEHRGQSWVADQVRRQIL